MKCHVSGCVFLVSLLFSSGTGIANAETIFHDDFQDGNALDGTPISWAPLPSWPGDIDAASGDLVITKTENVSPIIEPVGVQLRDTSIRAQFRLDGPAQSVVVGARSSNVTDKGYSAGINPNAGGMFIVRIEGPFGTQHTTLGFVPTDLNPLEEDILLQFDAIGDSLSVWAWRADETMPTEPQLTATDDALTMGAPYVGWGIGAIENPGPGVVRFVEVATHHIPEPSSCLLALIGISGLLHCRRSRCFIERV